MKKFWKIVSNWRKIVTLISLIKTAAEDKKVTGVEAEEVVGKAIEMLVEMDIIDAE